MTLTVLGVIGTWSRDPTPTESDLPPNPLMMATTVTPSNTDVSLGGTNELNASYREINDLQLHVVDAGDPDDPLVVLLHGHPDFWYGWRNQIGPLVDAGFRVVVPDQRGCNLSDAPDNIEAYQLSNLATDVCELIHSESRDSAHVVGHDFGGFVAWHLALRHPSMVNRLGILNVPHPRVYRETLRSSLEQIIRSWYVWFYQVPKVPEWLLRRNDMDNMVDSLKITSNEGTFDDKTVERYKTAWQYTGIEPRINWYRGFRQSDSPPRDDVTQPTLICWGEDDIALRPSMAEESIDYCDDGQLRMFPKASHWVHHEREEVTEELVRHLSQNSP